MKTQVTMTFSKSTKNTHVFIDESENAAIPTLYVKRSAFQGVTPTEIVVTVEASK